MGLAVVNNYKLGWILCSSIALLCLLPESAAVIVSTRSGPVQSAPSYKLAEDSQKITVFKGIPYAQAPIGKLRFEKPVPSKPWTDLLDASSFGPHCMQKSDKDINMSEDCLTLNIWVPGELSWSTPKAVMIFIHGGALQIGSGSEDLYEGSVLASTGNVIVVTINYRLGVFGFMVSGGVTPANLGFWDQHLAIQWVHDNIASFGGDASRVTIFGESAGAWSVAYQVISPHNNNTLFQRAIIQSGGLMCVPFKEFHQMSDAFRVAAMLGCKALTNREAVACIKMQPTEEFVKKVLSTDNMFLPYADGDFVLVDAYKLLVDSVMYGAESVRKYVGNIASYDILLGYNSQEGLNLFKNQVQAEDIRKGVSKDKWESLMKQLVLGLNFPNEYSRNMLSNMIGSAYVKQVPDIINKRSENDQRLHRLVSILGDYVFSWPTIEVALLHAELVSDQRTYLYEFDHKLNTTDQYHHLPSWLRTGAVHGDGLYFVFGRPLDVAKSRTNYTDVEKDLAYTMILYWSNFAKLGSPQSHQQSGRGGIAWPVFSDGSRMYIQLKTFSDEFAVNPLDDAAQLYRAAMVAYKVTDKVTDAAAQSTAADVYRVTHTLLLLVILIHLIL